MKYPAPRSPPAYCVVIGTSRPDSLDFGAIPAGPEPQDLRGACAIDRFAVFIDIRSTQG